MECKCKDWLPNIQKINAPIVLQTLRSGGNYVFDGEPWSFCPWCGEELVDEQKPDETNAGAVPRRGSDVGTSTLLGVNGGDHAD